MDECMDGMFEKWFDKISQASPEDKRKVDAPEMLAIVQFLFWAALGGFCMQNFLVFEGVFFFLFSFSSTFLSLN